MEEILIALALILGLWGGSLLEFVTSRLARKESLLESSRCPKCYRRLPLTESIPVVSWLWLRGRCAGCGSRVSRRYPLGELIAGVLSAAVAVLVLAADLGASGAIILYGVLAAAIFTVLAESHGGRVPASASYTLSLAVLLSAIAHQFSHEDSPRAFVGLSFAVAALLLHLALWMRKPHLVNFGVVRLAPLLVFGAAWVSPISGAVALVLPWLIIGAIAIYVKLRKKHLSSDELRYGSWLAGISISSSLIVGYILR